MEEEEELEAGKGNFGRGATGTFFFLFINNNII